MISHLRGVVSAAGPTWVVVDLSGFGLRVTCPPATAASARIGSEMELETSLVVREDSLSLHGFGSAADRDAFELVQTASGVGPKLAMAMLSVLDADQLGAAIAGEDAAALCRVPGIGKKGAAKLILELKDKAPLISAAASAVTPVASSGEPWREQVSDGLIGLGWSARDAEKAVESVAGMRSDDPDVTIGVLMRAALRSLAK
ncbi:MAG: Holliday junction branch migration protein RuvA [Acidipropionibacterium acidipropionici]|jgi:Holliday junction DNA helicase RuvA|uniref:Holliday junction branch migration complex subunit RuvA n=2 Tax=Acidipropionibacterium acidipropionici TaxID=1748 RepID=A0A142KEA5_9ACTN|nr:Holliday junction branch migration protein RuvA [Acidipropionibacterium acidipropionici]AFV89607.1 Holliday junction ATP-dependent DNA helicase ruvA [Acidipropionibacterium acidipropionici ATCC 4875]ALN15950.1 ATP-dependent DNA helicase RuvA [Acidipropionibacterium acidipropionici]AMS04443.1 Holliday junction ATP-dependent DNA helicase RuvA [Acidipropionibacterium acidipropionici]AOZ45938.1 Holliday junction DNA helicase RuvA [Acidipropionibacterium acidipropionici]APZ08302.1 Holliday junct